MQSTDTQKWNVAVLNINWRADRHDESHSIEFHRPTADNPTPEHPVVKGGILSTDRLPMSSEWNRLFASVKVKDFDDESLTVQYGVHEYTVRAGQHWVKLDEGGMSYTSFWLYLGVKYVEPKPKPLALPHDEEFLRRFRLKERVLRLTEADVQLLREHADKGDAYAQYGLARWLYYAAPTDSALREAEKLLLASMEQVPDALASYAMMWCHGETHENVMNLEKNMQLLQEALGRGSVRAAQQIARTRIFGLHCEAEPDVAAREIEQRLTEEDSPDPFWHTLLAFAYEEVDRRDDAIPQYEEAIRQGDVECYADLATIYRDRGNIALYDSLMEEGVRKGSNLCCLHNADMADEDYQQLSDKQRRELHEQLDDNLRQGVRRGSDACNYVLWLLTYYEILGFRKNDSEWPALLKQGARQGNVSCIAQIAEMAEMRQWTEQLSQGEIEEMWLRAARYSPDNSDALKALQHSCDPAFLLRHKEELEKYWKPRWEKKVVGESREEPEPKTPTDPRVFTIEPSGRLDLIEADVYKIKSYREMAQTLIDGDGLDAVHFSPLLKQITEEVGLDMNLAMYVDRDGYAKDLPDNAIGTMLYGQGQEVRGTVILCLEDKRYDCNSLTMAEDITGVYKALLRHFGSLLIVDDEEDDYDEDDGRWDAHV